MTGYRLIPRSPHRGMITHCGITGPCGGIGEIMVPKNERFVTLRGGIAIMADLALAEGEVSKAIDGGFSPPLAEDGGFALWMGESYRHAMTAARRSARRASGRETRAEEAASVAAHKGARAARAADNVAQLELGRADAAASSAGDDLAIAVARGEDIDGPEAASTAAEDARRVASAAAKSAAEALTAANSAVDASIERSLALRKRIAAAEEAAAVKVRPRSVPIGTLIWQGPGSAWACMRPLAPEGEGYRYTWEEGRRGEGKAALRRAWGARWSTP